MPINKQQVAERLNSLIPDSAYPTDKNAKDRCRLLEETILLGWELMGRFSPKSFDRPRRDGLGRDDPFADVFASAKMHYADYLVICQKAGATAPAYLMRELTRLYPDSGLAWYCLFWALPLDKANTNKDEVSRCLENAAKYRCDYVKAGENGISLSPPF